MKVLRWLGELLRRARADSRRDEARVDVDEGRSETRKSSSAPRHVTVGIDFGTSSTKVVFRDWNTKDRTPYAVDFGVTLSGYTRFSRPSLVAVEEGRLLLGEPAEEAAGRGRRDSVVRSSKVQLLREHVESPSLEIPWEIPNDLTARGASTLEGLVTLFLADTIREALWAAAAVYPSLPPSGLAFNLDVPVSGLEERAVGERFQRMLDVAIPLSRQIGAEMEASDALQVWAETLREVQKDPPEEGERPGELVPEAEAIIQGAGSALGSRSSDLYHAIVDIGAGTTDVGWFKFVEARTEDRLPFFAAATRPVGCNDLDARLVDRVVEGSGSDGRGVHSQVVRIKPSLVAGETCSFKLDGHMVSLGPDDLDAAAEEVAGEVYDHYSRTFGPAYKLDKDTDRWNRIRTVVVGGGSLVPALTEPFKEHPRTFGNSVELIDLSSEMQLRTAGDSNRPPAREETPFLTAALGLSHPKAVMPRPIKPSDIDALPRSSGPTGPYDYTVDY